MQLAKFVYFLQIAIYPFAVKNVEGRGRGAHLVLTLTDSRNHSERKCAIMKRRLWVKALALGLFALPSAAVFADHCCRPACPPCATAPATCMVEKTVLVPQMTTETRKVMVTECRPETRTRKVTVCRMVEEKKEVSYEYCVWKSETRTRQETYQVSVPEWKEVTTEYTVMVPHTEKRQGVRKVMKCVPTTEKRTVCEHGGHWEDRPVQVQTFVQGCDACGRPTCCPQTVTCNQKVWVPEVHQKEIEVTVNKMVCEDHPYEYEVTVCKPEKRTCTNKVCVPKCETRTRDVQYTVCVPEKKTGTRTVVCCKPVAEERDETCTVMVPHQVEKEVQVCVCRMVEKKIQVAVCCPQPAPCAPACCAPAPTCCQAAPTCCAPAPACCTPAPSCCHAAPACCR